MPLTASFARKAPYPVLLRAFLAWHRLTYARRSLEVRKATNIRPLSALDLTRYKRSDTVFLLGSGPSINCISESRWEAIRKHDTWGFNFWPYHRVVPTLYFLEAINYDLTRHIYDAFIEMAQANAQRYLDVPKIISELFSGNADHFVGALPATWQQSLYHAQPVTPTARNVDEFRHAIRYLRGRGVFDPRTRVSRLFKYASSLSMLVALAVNLGYRRIVLCGVDLTSQEYFYQDPQLYPEHHTLVPERIDQPHLLVRDFEWLIKLHDVLDVMHSEVLQPAGIELYVEHTGSALWPRVPLAPEALFGEAPAQNSVISS